MKVIPITADQSQTFGVQLDNQNCQINIYQKSTGLYLDLKVNNVNILSSRLCLDRVKLVGLKYLGFSGDLVFLDTQGLSDPEYTGLNSRYIFVYFSEGEI